MKKIGRNNLKIVAATAMTIFSLFAAAAGAYAWFTTHLQENSQMEEMEIAVSDGRLKNIYFHQYQSKTTDSVTQKPTSFTFESAYSGKISYDWVTHTATYSGASRIQMQDYSPLDSSQPILMVFELNDTYEIGDESDLQINASTDVEGFLGARDANNAPQYDLKTTGVYYSRANQEDPTKTDYFYALSSVVHFYCNDSASELYNKSGDENTTLINTTYSVSNLQNRDASIAAKELDPDADVPDLCFTSVNNANDVTTFNQTPSIYKAAPNSTVKYISVIVDYYSDAMEYIYSTYLGNDTLETEFESHLEFLCDWGLEID